METRVYRSEAGLPLSVNGLHAITVLAMEGRWWRVSATANLIAAARAPSDGSYDSPDGEDGSGRSAIVTIGDSSPPDDGRVQT
jgi:hypothetical protein